MRLKKFGALFLTGAMITGTIGVMSPTEAKAATPANTYTMTVPANVDIQKSGWNSLGDIKITGPVDSLKKVTVTASTTNDFKLVDADKAHSVSYTMKTAENGSEQKSFEFAAASINADGGASQAIGVDVEDFAGTPAGTYTDTIQFKGTMTEELLWKEGDHLDIVLEDNTYQYVVYLDPITLDGNIAGCQKHKKSDSSNDNDEYLEIDLKKDGNVFTFTSKDDRADFDITINFSNKEECKITRNPSTYTFICVVLYNEENTYVLVDNRLP